MTNEQTRECPDHTFLIGLIAGSVLGVGATVFGMRLVSEIRAQAVASAKSIVRKAQDVRDDACDAVVHGAQEVERYATEAKTDRTA